jgi:hypothetical protein
MKDNIQKHIKTADHKRALQAKIMKPNLRTKIVCYGRHCDNRTMNDDYKIIPTLNTYCGILSKFHNYKNKSLSLIEFFVGII